MDSEGNMIYSPPFVKTLTVCFVFVIDETHNQGSFQGLDMTFPIDNSFSGCYKDRQSCVDNDFPSEVNSDYYRR